MPDISVDVMREHRLMRLISDDPSIILLIRPVYTTENMWRIAIEQEPSLFRYMKNPSQEMCMFALKEDGSNLRVLVENPDVEVTPQMCYRAVKAYPPAIFDVPVDMRDDAIKEYAFDHDPTLMRHFSNVRPGYINRKLREDPTFARFLEHPTEDQEYRAIEYDPNYCVHLTQFTPRIMELIRTLYPDILPLISNLQRRHSGD